MTEKEQIKAVLDKAYVEGIHTTVDETTIRTGFHPDFNMLALDNGNLVTMRLDQWLERLEERKKNNPEFFKNTVFNYEIIDVTDGVACIKGKLYKGDDHRFTDYMFLYKFPEGWKVVSKVFAAY